MKFGKAGSFVKLSTFGAILCLSSVACLLTDDEGTGEVSRASSSFEDVPTNHRYFHFIEALYRNGYVAGCSAKPRRYCPENYLTRAEMAVFVVRGGRGADFTPPDPTKQIFEDVPLNAWYAKWVHQLYKDGYTAGCNIDPFLFCPLRSTTRAEATVFFLRILKGRNYQPQATSKQNAVCCQAWQ